MKSKIQVVRIFSQLIFLGIWSFGIYYKFSYLILFLLGTTLIFGNFFCGWVCPFGSAQNYLGRIGSLITKKKLKMPNAVHKYLKYTRYVIFAIILLKIAPNFIYDLNGYTSFLFTAYDIIDATFILSFSNIIMITYLVIALFFERPFCNYLCTEGVKFGLSNIPRIFSIKRNKESCVNCKFCDKKCPQNIIISSKDYVRDIQCINCMECITACPIKDTLKYQYIGWKIRKPPKQKN